MQLLSAIVASVLLGVEFSLNKIYQGRCGAEPRAVLLYNCLLGLVNAVIFAIVGGIGFTWYSLIMAALLAILVMSYTLLGFGIIAETGSVSRYTLFLMTGGMVLPYIWGTLFRGEPLGFLRTLGIAVIALGVVLPSFDNIEVSSAKGSKVKLALMCTGVFVINGLTSIVGKMHQTESVFNTVDAIEFVSLNAACRFVIAGLLLLVFARRNGMKGFNFRSAFIITPIAAVINGSSYFLQLLGAESVPATVLYPLLTGATIVFTAVFDMAIFKNRLSRRMLFGIVLCIAGSVMCVI